MPGGPLVQTINPWALSYGAGQTSTVQRTYYKDRYGRCTVGPALNPADDFGPCDLQSQMGPALSPQAMQVMTAGAQPAPNYPSGGYPSGSAQPININVGGGGAYPVPYPTAPSGPSWGDLLSIFGSQQPAPQTPVLYSEAPTYQSVGPSYAPGDYAPESLFTEQPMVKTGSEEPPKSNWLLWLALGGAAVYALTRKKKGKKKK